MKVILTIFVRVESICRLIDNMEVRSVLNIKGRPWFILNISPGGGTVPGVMTIKTSWRLSNSGKGREVVGDSV